MKYSTLRLCLFAALAALSCTETSMPDSSTQGSDTGGYDIIDSTSDQGVDNGLCPIPQTVLENPISPLPSPASPHRGIDSLEKATFQSFVEAVLQDPGIHFVTTYDHESDHYIIHSGASDERVTVRFQRQQDETLRTTLEVVDGDLVSIFPSQDPSLFNRYEDLLATFENPHQAVINGADYAPGDPRVGFIPDAKQSFPLVLERIAALFDAPDAPDLAVGIRPWAHNSPGRHAGMSTLQSRSTLIIKGPGVRKGAFLDEPVKLVDVVPTVLALLGAPTTGGTASDGVYADGLHLKWQDGRVLHEVFEPGECARPKYALIVLFDGLLPTEILHQVESPTPDVELPAFQEVIFAGTSFRSGAVSNFPSVSAPGHMTAGSGLWSGHHGFVANTIYRRSTRERITAFALLDDVPGTLGNPQILMDIYEKSVAPGVETLAQAAHRAFGVYDPESNEGAFTVVLNDLPLGDADYTTVDFILARGSGGASPGASVTTYSMADAMGVSQVETVLSTAGFPVPKTLQISLFSTDAAGEERGPHSNLLRSVLKDQDENLQRILNAYANRGVLHETLVVLVSDHGMELQDPTRNHTIGTYLNQSKIKAIQSASGLYFLPTLKLKTTSDIDSGDLKITTLDHWNEEGVEGVTVRCVPCEPMEQQTDSKGEVIFSPSPNATKVVVETEHNDFNSQSAELPWP